MKKQKELIGLKLQKLQNEAKRMTTVKDVVPWEPLVPFTKYDVPTFPVDIFPVWLSAYIVSVSKSTQTPADLSGMLALSVLATVAAGKFEIKINDSWIEPLNLYSLVALPPASRKSAVFALLQKPLLKYEKEKAEEVTPAIIEALNLQKILEQELKYAQNAAAKSQSLSKRENLRRLGASKAQELEELRVPVLPLLCVDDVTPEKLVNLLSEHSGKMAILSAEGGTFDLIAGRYNHAANLDVYLKGHAGDMLRVDRINRKSEFIEKPKLTIGLVVQNDVVKGLADNPSFRGRGLLARFLYSLPTSNIGNRSIDAPAVPVAVESSYSLNIRRLLAMPESDEEAYKLRLSANAEEEFNTFCGWLEPQLIGDLEKIQDWAGKLAGAVARIAGILHIAGHERDLAPWTEPIQKDTIEKTVKLSKYLILHALAAFAEMGSNPDIESAKHILKLIKKLEVAKISKRDLHNKLQSRFKKVSELDVPLLLLIERNYIREKQIAVSKTGRKPSPTFEINPKFISHLQLKKEGNSVPSVCSVRDNKNAKNNYMMAGEI